jgi:Family of unknown function (DUF5335)
MPTTTREIPREDWRSYFDELTDVLGSVEATVEVVGRDVSDQFPAERHVLTDNTYDDATDPIVVGLDAPGPAAGRMEHRIERPQRVLLATGEPPPLEVTFDILDGDDHRSLIRLERPPALPGE